MPGQSHQRDRVGRIARSLSKLTYETEKQEQQGRGKGDSGKAAARQAAQADGAPACCLGTLIELSQGTD